MEDEHRPLPEGWVRQWDDKEQHQFFVDTKANPPRSIWHHPHDDETYLNSLTSEQRERIQEEERGRRYNDHSDDESGVSSSSKASAAGPPHAMGGSHSSQELPPRPTHSDGHGKIGFGEKMKQKLTGQTKEERAEYKRQQEEEERKYYEAHMKFRQCLQRAQMTGEPQFFAKDREGKDIYIEPPRMGYGAMGPRTGMYGGGYGYNPYTSGPYSSPNARFMRPGYPYSRPYGGGYGGGMGMPLAGGLLGGMMLGGLMF